jgi:hypothetical protein
MATKRELIDQLKNEITQKAKKAHTAEEQLTQAEVQFAQASRTLLEANVRLQDVEVAKVVALIETEKLSARSFMNATDAIVSFAAATDVLDHALENAHWMMTALMGGFNKLRLLQGAEFLDRVKHLDKFVDISEATVAAIINSSSSQSTS